MEDFAQGQSVIQAGWNTFSFSWKFPAARVFPEREEASPQTFVWQILHPECRQSSSGNVVVAATCATTPRSLSNIKSKQRAKGSWSA